MQSFVNMLKSIFCCRHRISEFQWWTEGAAVMESHKTSMIHTDVLTRRQHWVNKWSSRSAGMFSTISRSPLIDMLFLWNTSCKSLCFPQLHFQGQVHVIFTWPFLGICNCTNTRLASASKHRGTSFCFCPYLVTFFFFFSSMPSWGLYCAQLRHNCNLASSSIFFTVILCSLRCDLT